MEKVVLNESMSAKMASRVYYLVYYYCQAPVIVYRVNFNKLLQIITNLRWSNKDNNN